MVNDIGKIILLTAGLLSGVGLAITGVIVHDSQALTAGVGMAMGVTGLPTTILIDAQGRELGRMLGDAEWDSPEAIALVKQAMGK